MERNMAEPNNAPEGTGKARGAQAEAVARAREILASADRVLIGAGAGLSTAAGFSYSGERFERSFAPFIRRYGMTDMYSGGFYPFPTPEDKWAFWAQNIWVNRFQPGAAPLYRDLLEWARTRDYFVITTNVDAQFELAGFDADRVFATQGDYGYIQCKRGCHDRIYPDREMVEAMRADLGAQDVSGKRAAGCGTEDAACNAVDGAAENAGDSVRTPGRAAENAGNGAAVNAANAAASTTCSTVDDAAGSAADAPTRVLRTRLSDPSLVPVCPVCGGPMEMHLRCDGFFVEDAAWRAANERYQRFVADCGTKRTVLLELGVGWNTPVWIRYPFERIAQLTGAPLVRMNYDDAAVSPRIPNAVGLKGDIAEIWPLIAK